ncbi:Alpha/Beta hydrolase protein [Roridomyces roridus]|uniref:Alpha/Beta hydrolase protein n=1 Tax=Roridomyces roridus TaxID=1738132 RepID=A0AAD7BXU9_9AGAR|nr:Alpha/Beta hydrolase protein [Roridomyces roridus]
MIWLLALLVGLMGALYSIVSRRDTENTIRFSSDPIQLQIRKHDGSVYSESLQRLVEQKCPTLRAKFYPSWWITNGHIHTLLAALGDFSKVDPLQYDRHLLRLRDGGTLGLDFAPADSSNLSRETPIIVVLHGLTGGSYESYVRSVLAPACKSVREGGLGYRAVVVNFRGCAGVPVTSPQLYSAGYTGDIRQALVYISQLYPGAPLLGLGFSLGANIMTRYIAEEGEQCRLTSACALANPWDLAKNNDGLNNTYIGKIYSRAMGQNLVNLVRRNLDGLAKFPDHMIAEHISAVLTLKNPLMEEFDDTMTRVAGGPAPDFPFVSAQDYYKWGSSHKIVSNIRIPYLAINAADDPIVQHVPMDGGGNPWVVMALTADGGHLGWFGPGSTATDRWIKTPVLEWISATKHVVLSEQSPRRVYTEDGFFREEGRDGGCKRIDGGGLVDSTSHEGIQGL